MFVSHFLVLSGLVIYQIHYYLCYTATILLTVCAWHQSICAKRHTVLKQMMYILIPLSNTTTTLCIDNTIRKPATQQSIICHTRSVLQIGKTAPPASCVKQFWGGAFLQNQTYNYTNTVTFAPTVREIQCGEIPTPQAPTHSLGLCRNAYTCVHLVRECERYVGWWKSWLYVMFLTREPKPLPIVVILF